VTAPTPSTNPDRALRYVVQALDLLAQLEGVVSIPTPHVGAWVSLQRNLEGALVDLGGSVSEQPRKPGA